jgi:hypothetical protein
LKIENEVKGKVTAEELSKLFRSSGIKRPDDDIGRLNEMIFYSNSILKARENSKLVWIAMAMTDFRYCCYLSDLAFDSSYQRLGIGKKPVDIVKKQIGERSMLLLLSASGGMNYNPGIGFELISNAFLIKRLK